MLKEILDQKFKQIDRENRIKLIRRIRSLKVQFPKRIKRTTLKEIKIPNFTNSELIELVYEVLCYYFYTIPIGYKRYKNSGIFVKKDGSIIYFNRRKLEPYKNRKGYLGIFISYYEQTKKISKNTTVHRVVAETYIDNPFSKPQVNHINGIKTDNRVENLEWVTNLENMRHAIRIGLRNTPALKAVGNGQTNSQAKLTDNDVKQIRKVFKKFKQNFISIQARFFNVNENIVEKVLNNENVNLERFKIPKLVRNSRSKKLFTKYVWCCSDPKSFIKGKFIKEQLILKQQFSNLFNVTIPTISNILAKRSWDYNHLYY